MAVFLGNGLIAIVSGLLAHGLVESAGMGPTAPFDAAIVVLLIGGVIIVISWSENYGDNSEKATLTDTFRKAGNAIFGGAAPYTGLSVCAYTLKYHIPGGVGNLSPRRSGGQRSRAAEDCDVPPCTGRRRQGEEPRRAAVVGCATRVLGS